MAGKKKSKRGFLSKNYRKCFSYIRENDNFYFLALILFIFAVLIGYLFPVFFTTFIQNMINSILEQIKGLNTSEIIFFILNNNIKSSFFVTFFGFIFGIIPVLSVLFNGYLLGFVAVHAVQTSGSFSIVLKLLPHGIFEIPALVLAVGSGMRFGVFLFKKNKKEDFIYNLENILRLFLFVILPLLIIAGIIEGLLIGAFG
jgi:stage II sporulation protein M